MLRYGNPSQKSVLRIQHSILVREWGRLGRFTPLLEMPYPDEPQTQKELWALVDRSRRVDSGQLHYIQQVEDDVFGVMSRWLASYGKRISGEQLEAKFIPYMPIIDYLKASYNRPRPHQAAGYYGIPLYPQLETDTGTAAYPSSHTFAGLLFRHYCVMHHRDLVDDATKLVQDIKRTREDGGVHYPSDGIFAAKVYQHLQQWIIL